MALDPQRSLVPLRDWQLARSASLFCPAPTVLEAINCVLARRGMAVLYVQADGTIGPTDPLLLQIPYEPSPFFVC
jgi:hypothetical protein